MNKSELGKWGEQLAINHLVGQGYAIVDTNWRINHFELDMVAMKGGRIIFVEVKTRADFDCDPIEAITPKKQANMISSANAYVRINDIPHEIQFDVITIKGSPEHYELEHYPDAFAPSLRSRT